MSNKEDSSDNINLRVNLRSPFSNILTELKDQLHFTSYADAIRHCITKTHEQDDFSIEQPYLRKINKLLENAYFRNTFYVTNVKAFVNKALEHYLEYIDSKFGSIKEFDIRAQLNEEELEIALEFLQCQEEDPANQVTLLSLMKITKRRNEKMIRSVLDGFCERGLLSYMDSQGVRYYSAR